MQVVSKWHNTRTIGQRSKGRVEPVLRGKQDRSNRDQTSRVKALVAAKEQFHGHSLIAAQVVATNILDTYDITYDASNQLAGTAAYDEALDRKIHRMNQGSFYQEAV